MKVLGLMRVRNAVDRISGALDRMATYCDSACVFDDRSTDGTREALTRHPLVSNVFSADPTVSNAPWYHSEAASLELLYRMADFYEPSWIVMLDDDDTLEPATEVRALLESAGPEVAGIRVPRISIWADPLFPGMAELMALKRPFDGRLWRHRHQLRPGSKWLHNGYLPANVSDHGEIVATDRVALLHRGWKTLAARIGKAEMYTTLDPTYEWNGGIPYDTGLLFGYRRDQVAELIDEYHRRRLALARTKTSERMPADDVRHEQLK